MTTLEKREFFGEMASLLDDVRSMTEATQPEATELLTRMAMSTNKSHQ